MSEFSPDQLRSSIVFLSDEVERLNIVVQRLGDKLISLGLKHEEVSDLIAGRK